MTWPNSKVIEARLSAHGLAVANLRFLADTPDHQHHAKLTGTDTSGNKHSLFLKKHQLGESVGNKELFAHQKIIPSTNTHITPTTARLLER